MVQAPILLHNQNFRKVYAAAASEYLKICKSALEVSRGNYCILFGRVSLFNYGAYLLFSEYNLNEGRIFFSGFLNDVITVNFYSLGSVFIKTS